MRVVPSMPLEATWTWYMYCISFFFQNSCFFFGCRCLVKPLPIWFCCISVSDQLAFALTHRIPGSTHWCPCRHRPPPMCQHNAGRCARALQPTQPRVVYVATHGKAMPQPVEHVLQLKPWRRSGCQQFKEMERCLEGLWDLSWNFKPTVLPLPFIYILSASLFLYVFVCFSKGIRAAGFGQSTMCS